jgi:hypothetical protein
VRVLVSHLADHQLRFCRQNGRPVATANNGGSNMADIGSIKRPRLHRLVAPRATTAGDSCLSARELCLCHERSISHTAMGVKSTKRGPKWA